MSIIGLPKPFERGADLQHSPLPECRAPVTGGKIHRNLVEGLAGNSRVTEHGKPRFLAVLPLGVHVENLADANLDVVVAAYAALVVFLDSLSLVRIKHDATVAESRLDVLDIEIAQDGRYV